jgi:hypothetical protein
LKGLVIEVKKMKFAIRTVLILIICFSLSFAVFASPSIVTTTAQRNAMAYNWTYYTAGVYENNCLGWALGNTTNWVWPWGTSNPTLSQVNTYMFGIAYTGTSSFVMSCDVYAYGSTSNVTHFARGLGDGPLTYPISAKWGHCEVFKHTSTNPYKSVDSGSYGSCIRGYNK